MVFRPLHPPLVAISDSQIEGIVLMRGGIIMFTLNTSISTPTPDAVYLFLLPGFPTASVASWVETLRQQGQRVQVVGLTPAPVSGAHGLRLQPDVALGDLSAPGAGALLIIPNCDQTLPLMIEPRLHRFIQGVLDNQGSVVVAPAVSAALARVGYPRRNPDHYQVLKA